MLEVKGISKSYGSKLILKNITQNFYPGESTVVVGESGGGKTTLAKIIIGLKNQDMGEIIFDGENLGSLKKRNFKQCKDFQYIFQDPYSVFEPKFTVEQTLDEVRRICKRNKAECLSFEEALDMVDKSLKTYLKEKVEVLSGGQRQKLSIARSLMTKAKVIIADEITSMLDKESKEEINQLLVRLTKDNGLILIYIAHEVDFKKDNWDKIMVIKDGSVIDEGKFKSFDKWCLHDYSKTLLEAYKYFEEE